MSSDCGSCLSKYVLCLFNFVFFLAGSSVLGVGLWLAFNKSSIIGLLKVVPQDNLQQFTQPAVIEQVAYIFIFIGGFMFIVSFLGYCGALRESQCLLTTYSTCLLIILVLEIAAGTLAVIYKTEAEKYTKDILSSVVKKHYATGEEKTAVTLLVDHLQATMHCCGAEDYTDYRDNVEWAKTGKKIPESCCVLQGDPLNLQPQSSNCVYSPTETNSYYRTGCYKVVQSWIMSNMNLVIIIAITIGLVEIVGIFLACCLTKSINQYMK